jgi:NAD+ diphosphatase
MVGFTARYASGDISPDGQEIEDARWFDREYLPDLPGKGSVAWRLIEDWIKGNSAVINTGSKKIR